jgi:hypothetical protein
MESLWPYGISWFYQYGVGGLVYAIGTYFCVRQNVLDFNQPRERRIYLFATLCLGIFATGHAIFQFVLPFAGS